MSSTLPNALPLASRIEFRLVELPKGKEHRYAVISCRVHSRTGRLLGYASLYHADKKGFCTQDILYIGLSKISDRELSLKQIEDVFYDKLLPILTELDQESCEILAALSEGYGRSRQYLQGWGASFTDYLRYQEGLSPRRRAERKRIPEDKAKILLGDKEPLSQSRKPRLKTETPYRSPFYPPHAPAPVLYNSKALPMLKGFDVRWQTERFWDLTTGPSPASEFSTVWQFAAPPARPGLPYKQQARRILKEFWLTPYRIDFRNPPKNLAKIVGFWNRPLADIGVPGIALVLSGETGRKISETQVRNFCSELKLFSSVKKGRPPRKKRSRNKI